MEMVVLRSCFKLRQKRLAMNTLIRYYNLKLATLSFASVNSFVMLKLYYLCLKNQRTKKWFTVFLNTEFKFILLLSKHLIELVSAKIWNTNFYKKYTDDAMAV